MPAANGGEAALIADPVESQAWYINFDGDFLTEGGIRAENRLRIAEFILKMTAKDSKPDKAIDYSAVIL